MRLGLRLRFGVEVGVEVFDLQMKSYHPLRVISYFFGRVGWLEIWRLKLISTQVVVEVEVGVELANILKILQGNKKLS